MLASYRQLSRNTVTLAASIGAVLAAFFMWNPVLPLYLRQLGANDGEIGVAFSIFIFAHTIPAIAGGVWADRIGRKWVAVGPGLILAPLYILAGLTRDWRILSLILIGTNIAGAVQWPAMQAMISESDETTRATAFSLIEIFVLSSAVVGPLLGSLLLPYVGVGGLIMAHGLVMIPATWVRMRLLKETHTAQPRGTVRRMNWRAALTPALLGITAAYAAVTLAVGLTVGGPFVAIFARDVWGLNEQQIQQLTALASLASFGGVWLGSKADRWGGRRMWVSTSIGFGVTLAGWALAPNVYVGAFFVMTSNLFFEALFIVAETMLAQHATRSTRSFIFGLYNTVGGFTEAVGPALGTGLASLARLSAPFLAGAIVSLLSILAIAPVGDAVTEEVIAGDAAE
jgi:MFS family permease